MHHEWLETCVSLPKWAGTWHGMVWVLFCFECTVCEVLYHTSSKANQMHCIQSLQVFFHEWELSGTCSQTFSWCHLKFMTELAEYDMFLSVWVHTAWSISTLWKERIWVWGSGELEQDGQRNSVTMDVLLKGQRNGRRNACSWIENLPINTPLKLLSTIRGNPRVATQQPLVLLNVGKYHTFLVPW